MLIPAALVVALGAAGTALAECNPEGGPCGPGGGTQIVSNTLTVQKSSGTVTSSPSGIDCGTDCTHVDTQSVSCTEFDCEPDPTAWDTLSLTASGGPAGYIPSWTGCGSIGAGNQCVVTVDEDKTVSLSWVDVQDPTVWLNDPPQNGVAGASMPVGASASDNAGVASVQFRVDGVTRLTDSMAPYAGALDMTSYTHGSEHVVTAVAVDTNGRTASSSPRTITVDRHVGVSLSTPAPLTNAPTVPVTITTDGDASTVCRIVGGAAPVGCGGTWSGVSAATPDGAYTYEVKATDAAGNTATATRSFVLDRTAPAISDFDGPTEGSVVGTDRVTFTFAASDANLLGVQCKVGSAAPGPCTSATSHQITGLTDGTVTFSLVATDKAGNESTRTRMFQVQRPVTSTGSTGGTTTQTQATTGTTGTSGTSGSSTTQAETAAAPTLKPNPAKLVFRKQRRGGRTRLLGLRVTGLPQGAKIAARCRGGAKRGCPRKPAKLAALAKLGFRKGAVLTITVTAPGYAPKTMTVRI